MTNHCEIINIGKIDIMEHSLQTAFVSFIYYFYEFDKETFSLELTMEEIGISEEDFLIILKKLSCIYSSYPESLTCIDYNNLNLKISEIIEEIDRILY